MYHRCNYCGNPEGCYCYQPDDDYVKGLSLLSCSECRAVFAKVEDKEAWLEARVSKCVEMLKNPSLTEEQYDEAVGCIVGVYGDPLSILHDKVRLEGLMRLCIAAKSWIEERDEYIEKHQGSFNA